MNLYYIEGDSGTKVVPDLMVTREVEDVPVTSYQMWEVGVPPQFVMEVLSPSTYVEDKGDKKDLYQRLGVDEYWLFDPQGGLLDAKSGRLIAGYSLDGGTEYGEIRPDPVGMLRSKVLELDICSVDGFLRFWNYENGELLGSLAEEKDARELMDRRWRKERRRRRKERCRRREAEVEAQRERQRRRAAEVARDRDRAELKRLRAELADLSGAG